MQPAADSSHLEGAIHALSERIDRLSVGGDSSGAMAHVEQRIAYLLERLEGSQPQGLGRIEEALSDVLRHLEQQRLNFASVRRRAGRYRSASSIRSERELSDVRHSQSATDRRTQDTLEALHSTLGHVVDRLAMIEGDLRRVQTAAEPRPLAQLRHMHRRRRDPPRTVQSRAAADERRADSLHRCSRSPFRDDEPPPLRVATDGAARADRSEPAAGFPAGTRRAQPRGRPWRVASDMSLGQDAAPPAEGSGQSNFIAAARRAAQAAAAATNEKPGRVTRADGSRAQRRREGDRQGRPQPATQSAKPSRIRSILVGFGVVVIVIGAFKVALTFLDDADSTPAQTIEKSAAPAAITPPPAAAAPGPKAEMPATNPLLISPTAVERHSFVAPANAAPLPASEAPVATRAADVTGSVPLPAASQRARSCSQHGEVAALSPVSDKIPDAVAGPDAARGSAARRSRQPPTRSARASPKVAARR